MAQEDARIQTVIKQQLLSESFDTVPSVKADHSIPALHETITEEVRTKLDETQYISSSSFFKTNYQL